MPVQQTIMEKHAAPGPVPGTRTTASYARQVGRFAYFWAWAMANIHNRLLAYDKLPAPGLAGPATGPAVSRRGGYWSRMRALSAGLAVARN